MVCQLPAIGGGTVPCSLKRWRVLVNRPSTLGDRAAPEMTASACAAFTRASAMRNPGWPCRARSTSWSSCASPSVCHHVCDGQAAGESATPATLRPAASVDRSASFAWVCKPAMLAQAPSSKVASNAVALRTWTGRRNMEVAGFRMSEMASGWVGRAQCNRPTAAAGQDSDLEPVARRELMFRLNDCPAVSQSSPSAAQSAPKSNSRRMLSGRKSTKLS